MQPSQVTNRLMMNEATRTREELIRPSTTPLRWPGHLTREHLRPTRKSSTPQGSLVESSLGSTLRFCSATGPLTASAAVERPPYVSFRMLNRLNAVIQRVADRIEGIVDVGSKVLHAGGRRE